VVLDANVTPQDILVPPPQKTRSYKRNPAIPERRVPMNKTVSRFFAFSLVLTLRATIPEPVRLQQGLLTGVAGTLPDVRSFKGIPFAQPPVGDLRWRPPKPAVSWTGTRSAAGFGAICMQRRPNAAGIANTSMPMSEDCLYLNVYTPAKTANDKRPVMVWIHGGALTAGAGSIYDSEQLAHKGVVVVTINYRLGVFGFFAHPELTKESDHRSNYGLLDQIAALQWVKRNIAAFGGDPGCVTIFGESAGSWSTNLLAATPLAHGLFQRVIGESGAQFEPLKTLARAEETGTRYGTLADLRAKSAETIQNEMGAAFVGANGAYSGPVVDGWSLPQDVYTIYSQGKQNDVPVLIGSNADEGTMFIPATANLETLKQSAQRYGANADAFLKLYPAQTDAEAWRAQADALRDLVFGWEMRTWARMQSKTGKSRVYLYFFSRVPPGQAAARMGAYHSAEIAYAFDNTRRPGRPWEDVDHRLSEAMSSYWVNFATTGDPNRTGLPEWPAFDPQKEVLLDLGDEIAIGPIPHKAALDFFDAYFARQR
jgi:para-nitrobenzyl esterase